MKTTSAFRYQRGFICGRFYPFHLGHKKVLEQALAQCASVYVCVCQRQEQSISAEVRARWIEESFGAEVGAGRMQVLTLDQDKLNIPDRSAELWAQASVELLGFAPDAVFTSEPYQGEYAALMGAELVLVDVARAERPVSGTQIRHDPLRWQRFLEPHVWQAIQGRTLASDQ